MIDPKAGRLGKNDGETDLPDDVKRRIDDMLARVGAVDHYTLLGLGRSASRAEVRAAFRERAPAFHPDRYFGRKLGVYSERMQRVFAQMSLAHDTLIDDVRRIKYDATLPPPAPSEEAAPIVETAMPAPPKGATPPPEADDPSSGDRSTLAGIVPEAAAKSDRPRSPSPPSTGTRAAQPSSPEMERAKAQAFAARLAGNATARMRPGAGAPGGAQPASRKPVRASTPGMAAIDPKAAVESLRRRYEEQKERAMSSQAKQHVQAAQAAEGRGEYAEAARLYRLALGTSSDATLKAVAVQAEERAREQACQQSVVRAKEAEAQQQWPEAGTAWARAFDLVPNAEYAHGAANAFRRMGTDLRRAVRYGEDAVKLDPKNPTYRVTLALIYMDAGLMRRAHGEMERALALDPKSKVVKEAAARLKKR
jgi:tetratricopeptide (TPR) repeat protein